MFREPELQDLIRKALTNNYDLRIAAQRILEQQAQVQIPGRSSFPTLSVGGTGAGVDIPGISSYTGGGANSISSPIVVGSFQSLLRGTRTSGAFIASRRKLPAPRSWPKPGPSARCA